MLSQCLLKNNVLNNCFNYKTTKHLSIVKNCLINKSLNQEIIYQNSIRFNANYEKLKLKLKLNTSKEIENLQRFETELSELTLLNKFKKIVSEYYHVLVAVHVITSCLWAFLMILIKIKYDITPEPLVEYIKKYNVPEVLWKPLLNSHFQFIAVPYFFYKCVTPARYYTTVWCSMLAIRTLMPKGIIKAKKTPKIVERLFGAFKK